MSCLVYKNYCGAIYSEGVAFYLMKKERMRDYC
jgi:hypothetical protein